MYGLEVDVGTRAVIARLLTNLGSRGEVEQYLKHYGSAAGNQVVVIQLSGEVMAQSLDDVTSALAFLTQIGVQPIIIHGSRPQVRAALLKAGITTADKDLNQNTTPEILDVIRRVYARENNRLVDALEQLRVKARSINTGVFKAQTSDEPKDLTGQVVAINHEPIDWALRARALPIISPLGETSLGQILSLDISEATHIVTRQLRPQKLVVLNLSGGLMGTKGEPLAAVNLAEDYDGLMASDGWSTEHKDELSRLYELLKSLPKESSVSVTAAEHLARELFTHKGAGTLIRIGVRVKSYDSADEVNTVRVRDLLEGCFQKKLIENYFDTKDIHRIYLSDDYRATAIVTWQRSKPYLDKFGVTAAAQGEGIGASVWRRLRQEQKRLFWRARHNNPVNPWYFRNSDGAYRSKDWVVFWYGMPDFDAVRDCVECATSLPATLITENSST